MNLATGSHGQESALDQAVVFIAPPDAVALLQELFAHIPHEFPAAMIILHHTGTERALPIANNLIVRPRLPVMHGMEGIQIRKNRTYVVLASQNLLIGSAGRLTATIRAESGVDSLLDGDRKGSPGVVKAEPLLGSLAKYGRGAIAVALTALDPREVEGFRRIREANGHTMALDEGDREWGDPMSPRVAAEKGDERLTVDKIGKRMYDILRASGTPQRVMAR